MTALIEKGITVDLARGSGLLTPVEAAWAKFSRETPASFRAEMTRGLPPETQLTVMLDAEGRLDEIDFRYHRQRPGRVASDFFSVNHSIGRHRVPAYVMGNSQMSESLQDRGVTSLIESRVYDLCLRQDVEMAEITASKINTYAAARRGFVPNVGAGGWDSVRQMVAEKLHYLEAHLAPVFGPIPIEASDAARAGVEMDSPKGMWKIVDIRTPYAGAPLGKILTISPAYLPQPLQDALGQLPFREDPDPFSLTASWQGHLDLRTDPDFMNRARAYFNRRPPASPRGRAFSP